MKKLGMILIGVILSMNLAKAHHGKRVAQTTFSANRGQTISVTVDGRLVNHHSSEIVKLHLRSGERNIKVKVYDRRGRLNTVVRKRVHIKHGQSNHFVLSNSRYGDVAIRRMATTAYDRHGHQHNGHSDRRGGRAVTCDVSYY